ncbi:ribonuclease E/G [Kordiimonas sp.]|uniref:ribonuclease E/G n=1 Tax=Kordiimonas sp. TaxID=1970157 RepID=UPI003A8DDB4B
MTIQMIIEPGIGQWRSAVLDEDGFPSSLSFHDETALSPVDAIFRARVTKLDTTNDMAFLDLGNGLTGAMSLRRAKLLVKGRADKISDCVTEGAALIVQVVAESAASEGKAYSVTPRPRLMGRYVVVEAGGARLNFSKDLQPKAVKALTPLLEPLAAQGALIVRSRAGVVEPEVVAAEATTLMAALAPENDKPGLLFAFSPMEQALIAVPDGDGGVAIEGGGPFANARSVASERWPDILDRLTTYDGDGPAFEHYGVEEAIEEALAGKILLPSGGWISIHETPALTVVDVNMGQALKGRAAGDAKLIVNMEAAMAVGYHLRFQDIGGLVVVDFIDMSAKGAARDLMQALDAAFDGDSVPVQHTGVSQFGLVEISRKRKGLSLKARMQRNREPEVRPEAAALELMRKARRLGRSAAPGGIVITAPKAVCDWLEAHPVYRDDLTLQTQRALTFKIGPLAVDLA